MNNRMDTYSTFKGIVIPVLSAFTCALDGSAQFNVYGVDYLPSITAQMDVEKTPSPYYTHLDLDTSSSETIFIDSDALDLLTISSFAKRYIRNLVPIEASIQAVIDDYFWEML